MKRGIILGLLIIMLLAGSVFSIEEDKNKEEGGILYTLIKFFKLDWLFYQIGTLQTGYGRTQGFGEDCDEPGSDIHFYGDCKGCLQCVGKPEGQSPLHHKCKYINDGEDPGYCDKEHVDGIAETESVGFACSKGECLPVTCHNDGDCPADEISSTCNGAGDSIIQKGKVFVCENPESVDSRCISEDRDVETKCPIIKPYCYKGECVKEKKNNKCKIPSDCGEVITEIKIGEGKCYYNKIMQGFKKIDCLDGQCGCKFYSKSVKECEDDTLYCVESESGARCVNCGKDEKIERIVKTIDFVGLMSSGHKPVEVFPGCYKTPHPYVPSIKAPGIAPGPYLQEIIWIKRGYDSEKKECYEKYDFERIVYWISVIGKKIVASHKKSSEPFYGNTIKVNEKIYWIDSDKDFYKDYREKFSVDEQSLPYCLIVFTECPVGYEDDIICFDYAISVGNPAKLMSASIYMVRNKDYPSIEGKVYVITPHLNFSKETELFMNYSYYEGEEDEFEVYRYENHDSILEVCDSEKLDIVAESVGTKGGIINLNDEIILDIPPGALNNEVEIKIEKYELNCDSLLESIINKKTDGKWFENGVKIGFIAILLLIIFYLLFRKLRKSKRE